MATRAILKYNSDNRGDYYLTKLAVKSAKQRVFGVNTTILEILAQESTCETAVICKLHFCAPCLIALVD